MKSTCGLIFKDVNLYQINLKFRIYLFRKLHILDCQQNKEVPKKPMAEYRPITHSCYNKTKAFPIYIRETNLWIALSQKKKKALKTPEIIQKLHLHAIRIKTEYLHLISLFLIQDTSWSHSVSWLPKTFLN